MREIKCNEWECTYNQNGRCTTNDCPTMDDVLNVVHGRSSTCENEGGDGDV